MTYEETLQYLFASQPAFHMVGAAAYKPGFQNTIALLQEVRLISRSKQPYTQNIEMLPWTDNEQDEESKLHWLGHFRAVHIAGTNGKGSTSHLLAASLQAAGLKVGLYTSPHLVDFRERIRINGEMIPKEKVVTFVERYRTFLDELKPSFFESTMAMAFEYFEQEQVDVAVVEVGLGGRLDSTNILPPANAESKGGVVLSVITNIGMDHTEFLGNTLAKIAAEKAGIIKPGVPCVIGETHPETEPVFRHMAEEIWRQKPTETALSASALYFADQCEYLRRCREREIGECELHGLYQEKNMQTAYVALRALFPILGLSNFQEAVATGFAKVCTMTGLRGRWEILAKNPLTICDTGHNSHGIRYVAEQLKNASMHAKLFMVFGMVDDKDVQVVMKYLPKDATYYFTQAATRRAISAEKMRQWWIEAGGDKSRTETFQTVDSAIRTAQKSATNEDIIFIGGSNYVVGEALRLYM